MRHGNSTLSLKQQITLVIVLKLIGLTAIWWFFVQPHKVPHDAQHTFTRILAN
jgi:hypothetical protein